MKPRVNMFQYGPTKSPKEHNTFIFLLYNWAKVMISSAKLHYLGN